MGTVHYPYWHSKIVPVPVLVLYIGSLPVLAQSITSTGIQKWCPFRYWHFCTLVQYRYRHSPLPVLAFQKMVPILALEILYFGSVPVWTQSITGTDIQLCPYWYWQLCTWIQYQYGHIPLPELAFNCARTSTGIFALWFSTSISTSH